MGVGTVVQGTAADLGWLCVETSRPAMPLLPWSTPLLLFQSTTQIFTFSEMFDVLSPRWTMEDF